MKESKLKDLTKEQLEKYRADRLSFKEIAKKLNVGEATVERKAKELGVSTKPVRVYEGKADYFNINSFDNIDTEEKAYWLGFLFADGYIDHRYGVGIRLKASDKNHLLKFKKFLNDRRDDSVIREKTIMLKNKEFSQAIYTVYSKHIVDTLATYGCIQNKSLILKFPDINKFSKKELIYDFIRGYVDGDGSIYLKDKWISISITGTFDFLSGIKRIFPEFCNIRQRNNICDIYCYYSKAEQVAMKLYGHATVYLDRKFKRFATLCKLYTGEKSGNIGEGCDANTEITSEITKGSEES